MEVDVKDIKKAEGSDILPTVKITFEYPDGRTDVMEGVNCAAIMLIRKWKTDDSELSMSVLCNPDAQDGAEQISTIASHNGQFISGLAQSAMKFPDVKEVLRKGIESLGKK